MIHFVLDIKYDRRSFSIFGHKTSVTKTWLCKKYSRPRNSKITKNLL